MQRLLYISTARGKIDQGELDGILKTSRRNNAAVGVTGLLVVGGRRFLQVLEGPDLAVANTFARISKDARHLGVVSLARDTIATRSFERWSMGCVNGGNADRVGDPAAALAQLVAPIEDATLRGYFSGFVQTHAAA